MAAAIDALSTANTHSSALSPISYPPPSPSPQRTAELALRVSLWSVAGSIANRKALSRYETSLLSVKHDVAHGFSLLSSLRDTLADALLTARGLAQRVDNVENSQADMQATLAACTAQLRASRVSLSRLDSQLQALLSERVRHDAGVDALALYAAWSIVNSFGFGIQVGAWMLSRAIPSRPLQTLVSRAVATALRLSLFITAVQLLHRTAKRFGFHSGVGTPSSYAGEAVRLLIASKLVPNWLLQWVLRRAGLEFSQGCSVAPTDSSVELGDADADTDGVDAAAPAAAPAAFDELRVLPSDEGDENRRYP